MAEGGVRDRGRERLSKLGNGGSGIRGKVGEWGKRAKR